MDTDKITEDVIGAAFEVANVLGAGFLEKVYERALLRELAVRGVKAKVHVLFPVKYKGQRVGDYIADLLVEDRVIVELKCVDRLAKEHWAQCINYLKASGLRTALLINFQKPKLEWRRVLLDPCPSVANNLHPCNLASDWAIVGDPPASMSCRRIW
jgi:GxxExxY protein